MSIQLDGTLVSTTMRTPGHDYELAVGYCHGEGLLGGAEVRSVRYCADGAASETEFNVVTVDTNGMAPTPTPRLGLTSSSCGLCGSDSIDLLCERLLPLVGDPLEGFDLASMTAICERTLAEQRLFAATGAVHGAAAFDRNGAVSVVREDVGRHNAVDKVVGRLLLDGELPATDRGLFVSGRASFEMVQKAWSGGFPVVLSVSAPTSLAVLTARRANIALIGFVRGQRFNVYAPERLSTI